MSLEKVYYNKCKFLKLIILMVGYAILALVVYYIHFNPDTRIDFKKEIISHLMTEIPRKIRTQFELLTLKYLEKDNSPILIYYTPLALGDYEATMRLIATARQMGWHVLSHEVSQDIPEEKLKNAFGIYVGSWAAKKKRFPKNIPLFEIRWLVEEKEVSENSEDLINFFKKNPPAFSEVKGILLTGYKPIDIKIPKKNRHGNLEFIMTWYPTVKSTYYQPHPQPKELMFSGQKYYKNIRTELKKYQKLWEKLDKIGYFFIYGNGHSWEHFSSYQGYVPSDGSSFIDVIHRHGICLIMHNEMHLHKKTPSGRIFEAAAAAAVIISDRHPFIEREFKDSVLYIDQTRDDMFEQIASHMQWIKENPEKAQEKARLAHAIFLEKFTLEKQLARLYQYVGMVKSHQ